MTITALSGIDIALGDFQGQGREGARPDAAGGYFRGPPHRRHARCATSG
ncbi:hypothetical protein [Ruegeria marina]|uniref:Uncharacterized protein n=1 Tax=Ruegeria marina TaxID=639004 RepID=A0A1G6X937_9RHOB|nr:hypothetical protein [Ruegeria marina]SDD74622.1 hypothetical protein SAMN04488239_11011 [Ruegeria marina]